MFCTMQGEPQINKGKGTSVGWGSICPRFMERALAATNVKTKFTERDLRATGASNAATPDQTRALLSHADSRTTELTDQRKPERVTPLPWAAWVE